MKKLNNLKKELEENNFGVVLSNGVMTITHNAYDVTYNEYENFVVEKLRQFTLTNDERCVGNSNIHYSTQFGGSWKFYSHYVTDGWLKVVFAETNKDDEKIIFLYKNIKNIEIENILKKEEKERQRKKEEKLREKEEQQKNYKKLSFSNENEIEIFFKNLVEKINGTQFDYIGFNMGKLEETFQILFIKEDLIVIEKLWEKNYNNIWKYTNIKKYWDESISFSEMRNFDNYSYTCHNHKDRCNHAIRQDRHYSLLMKNGKAVKSNNHGGKIDWQSYVKKHSNNAIVITKDEWDFDDAPISSYMEMHLYYKGKIIRTVL
jgi:hypothetical protein